MDLEPVSWKPWALRLVTKEASEGRRRLEGAGGGEGALGLVGEWGRAVMSEGVGGALGLMGEWGRAVEAEGVVAEA